MNPNHPHYAGLGGGPNLNLLDNMLMAAGFQATDQPVVARPAIVPQYTYAQEVSTMQHHALNLGQTHTTTMAGSDPVQVIVYQPQNEQQQQPISYKIPQLGTVVAQEQNFVVNDQGGQIRQNPTPVSTNQQTITEAEPVVQQTAVNTAQSIARQVQSPAERRKDIVAQAMQEQKIFEDSVPKQEPIVKQEPGVSGAGGGNVQMANASTAGVQGGVQVGATTNNAAMPNNNGMQSTADGTQAASTAEQSTTAVDTKPIVTAPKTVTTQQTTTPQRRPYQRSANYSRQQVMPRLQILEDEDDGLTCRMCLASYWYKKELHEHLKTVHSIQDPDKYEKEEMEKKMRKKREEHQRILMARKQKEERERRLREAKYGRGRGGLRLPGGGLRPIGPGQRPSFQYREGAFICDLCKESFSDGNDMVTHWKSHVKRQQADMMRTGGRGRGRGRPMGYGRGRGRPSLEDKDDSSDSSDSSSGGKGKKKKGMPRWTAYLLWSTRKRREVVVDHPDWTFAQIAKWISEEWKKIDPDEKDELQKEAEEMNELGIRKLPRDDDGPDPEKDTTDEDSDFEEGYRRKTKPIMLKIKKEKKEKAEGGAEEGSSDESDWEPEAEVKPPTRESTRSGRQRKRPSFFQEFESQENNLDSILEQFEKQQAEEFGKPRPPKPEKPETEKKPRKPRKRKETSEMLTPKTYEEELEVEVLRSGRKRKVRRVMTQFADGSDEDDKLQAAGGASSDDEDFEPPPEDEVEKIEEHDDQLEDEEEVDSEDLEDEEDEDDLRYGDLDLPPKKRGRPKKLMTDEEIEEATRSAIKTKPSIEIIPVNKDGEGKGEGEGDDGEKEGEGEKEKGETDKKDGDDEEGDEKAGASDDGEDKESQHSQQPDEESDKVKPPWVKETLSDSEDEGSKGDQEQPGGEQQQGGEQQGEEQQGGEQQQQDDQEDQQQLADSLPLESIQTPAPMVVESLDTSAPPLDTPAPLESIDTPAPPDMMHDPTTAAAPTDDFDVAMAAVDDARGGGDNTMHATGGGGEDESNVAVTQQHFDTHHHHQLDGSEVPSHNEGQGPPPPSLTEEDLLTGPAHNLDDVEANLEDIFK